VKEARRAFVSLAAAGPRPQFALGAMAVDDEAVLAAGDCLWPGKEQITAQPPTAFAKKADVSLTTEPTDNSPDTLYDQPSDDACVTVSVVSDPGVDASEIRADTGGEQDDQQEILDMPTLPADKSAESKSNGNGDSEATCGAAVSIDAPQAPHTKFAREETMLIFDWDDTVLPSTWVHEQGLRLDEGSEVSEWQREQLVEVAKNAEELFRTAKQHGSVVLVTNAERGWIELSCRKFMPTLCPHLEDVKLLSARTTYESPDLPSPLDWKLRAFEAEILRTFGPETLPCPKTRKNVLSLGDSVHEREALIRATSQLPNCRSKSLKFVERPQITDICTQHSLVTSCFENIVHHDGNLDLCLRCT